MKTDIYSTRGKAGSVELSEQIFNAPWNPSLVHQVVTVSAGNLRQGSAHTKDRGEVAGGGKKPWRQKGTGRARHGSSRSPIWRHGGITFGPRNTKIYARTLTRSMKMVALASALSQKLRDQEILLVDTLVAGTKTKALETNLHDFARVAEGFATLCTKTNPSNVLLVVPAYNQDLLKAVRNLPYAQLTDALNLNTYQIAQARYVVVVSPAEVDALLQARYVRDGALKPAVADDISGEEDSETRGVSLQKKTQKKSQKKAGSADKKSSTKTKKSVSGSKTPKKAKNA